jgi:hypothetical protein
MKERIVYFIIFVILIVVVTTATENTCNDYNELSEVQICLCEAKWDDKTKLPKHSPLSCLKGIY